MLILTLKGEKDADFKNLFAKSRGSRNNQLLENLSKLPETENEVLEISKNFIKSNIFIGPNATEDNLKKFSEMPRIILKFYPLLLMLFQI